MEPALVESPLDWPPGHCAVRPTRSTGAFVDTGMDMTTIDGRIYLHLETLEELAQQFLPVVNEAEVLKLQSELEQVYQERDEARQELAEANRELDAIHVIRGKGWKPQKKTGPPRKVKEAA